MGRTANPRKHLGCEPLEVRDVPATAALAGGTLLVAGTPGFYELKRSRTKGPDFG